MAAILGVLVFFMLIATVTLCLMARNKSGCFAPREYIPSSQQENAGLAKNEDAASDDGLGNKQSDDEEVQLDSISG